MTLLLEEEVDIPFSFDYRKVAEDVIDKALEVEEFPYEVEVSLVLTDDAAIHELNQQFREMDRSTDVLSFPMMDYPAKEYGHSRKREYAFLIAHSMLHLMGYDHMTPDEATLMEEKQSYILDLLHITREEEKNV